MAGEQWWRRATIYALNTRTFADGNGDGIGDLPGLIDKLDYLAALGVDTLWLTPHFPSPCADNGYDVADYMAIAAECGTLDDYRRLLDAAHARGLHVLLDLVLNHTSDQHPWFIESASSRDNPRADWYVWADEPPNDWQSCFDGSAWTYHPARGQYYYHFFLREQPDLNWRHPAVKAALWAVAHFWLDLGVDGFRLDAISALFEDPEQRAHGLPVDLLHLRAADAQAVSEAQKAQVGEWWSRIFRHQLCQPEVHGLLRELRTLVDSYPGERILLGEDEDIAYLGDGRDELHLVMNFPLMNVDGPLRATHVREVMQRRLAALPPGGVQCNLLNHIDSSRLWTHFCSGEAADGHAGLYAKLCAALLVTLPGVPLLYYGEEIGMRDAAPADPERWRDRLALWLRRGLIDELGVEPAEATRLAARSNRDRCRTPMQWGVGANAGFCPRGVEPWLPVAVNDAAVGVNVEVEDSGTHSLLNAYRRLLALRRELPALYAGDWQPLDSCPGSNCLLFLRRAGEQTLFVGLNFGMTPCRPGCALSAPQLLEPLYSSGAVAHDPIALGPAGVLIARVP
ncbi:alpha-amylase family glycosyl hydrolase [Plasticicumulans acidivorans]|uniref:Alpha-glucosidase n=1 Tax=Plasticicumulans acidivorans TaxID=886464 RepID=A0A317N0X5_9GAMM|nr:alpha-amylase family glycosyl hydrolase [Plasticicumulans acidivorans]PWV65923.1 alpha-glucosidase [Plasticicumulans acidivorans]